MVLTASQCEAPHIMSMSQVNNASAYAVGLRLTMLQIYLYQYWTVAETQKKGRSAPRPCVDLIIIIILLLEMWCMLESPQKDISKKTLRHLFQFIPHIRDVVYLESPQQDISKKTLHIYCHLYHILGIQQILGSTLKLTSQNLGLVIPQVQAFKIKPEV